MANNATVYTVKKTFLLLSTFSIYLTVFVTSIGHVIAAEGNKAVPAELKPWVSWINKDLDFLDCPVTDGGSPLESKHRICAWPGKLNLKLSRTRGEFEQNWRVYKDSWVPLPGNTETWPQLVTVNGKSSMIFSRNDIPHVWLEKGTAKVIGYWRWNMQPESVRIPKISQYFSLTLNGNTINFPEFNQDKVMLAETSQEQSINELEVTSFRLIRDAHPIESELKIRLDVSGAPRQVNLGAILLKGFFPVGITSELPSFINESGDYIVTVRPGIWDVLVRSVAPAGTSQLAVNNQQGVWPTQEIWSFDDNTKIRIATLNGLPIVDPGTVDVPQAWRAFPSFVYDKEKTATLTEKLRDVLSSQSNQLTLTRRLWLDFDGSEWTFEDSINGQIRKDWRLDMQEPFRLARGEEQGESLLVTQLQPEQTGLELRLPNVQVTAGGTIANEGSLPVNGWLSGFEQVTWNLNLPPAYRLLIASGAESDNGWFSKWNLWNVFWLLIVVAVCFQYGSRKLAAVVLLTLILMFHESGAPLVSFCNAVFAFILYQNIGVKSRILSAFKAGYFYLSIGLLTLFLGLFTINQIRTLIHPQLEHYSPYKQQSFNRFSDDSTAVLMSEAAESDVMYEQKSSPSRSEKMAVTGSRIRQSDLMQKYNDNTVIQTGSGIPSWSWNEYRLAWNARVSEQQTTRLWIATPLVMNIWRVIMLLGLFISIGVLAKQAFGDKLKKAKWASVLPLAVFLYVPLQPQSGHAEVPSKEVLTELKQWLHQPPECFPSCVNISGLRILSEQDLQQETLTLEMRVDAMEAVAFALPKSDNWSLTNVKLNDVPYNWIAHKDNNDWLFISKGRQKVTLQGVVSNRSNLVLNFPVKPFNIQNLSTIWNMEGARNGVLLGQQMVLIKKPEAIARLQPSDDSSGESKAANIRPLVKVIRHLWFDTQWRVETSVQRIAPQSGEINLKIPLLPFERSFSSNAQIKEGEVSIQIPRGESQVSLGSSMAQQSKLQLEGTKREDIVEEWRFTVAHQWRVEADGLNPVWPESFYPNDIWSFRYLPRAGESLQLNIQSPKSIEGASLAFDKVDLNIVPGLFQRTINLELNYRSSRGGQSTIQIGEGEQLVAKIDGQNAFLQIQDGAIDYTTLPGSHKIELQWVQSEPIGVFSSAPTIDIKAPSSNVGVHWQVPRDRWVIWASGPTIGPAIIYWGELLAFLLLAVILWRTKVLPIPASHWLILGLGLSMQSWWLLVVFSAWLIALELHHRKSSQLGETTYNVVKVFLSLFSGLILLILLITIPFSLLSRPDMGIQGNQSSGYVLNWYADQAAGLLPDISVISLPTWCYKLLMLVWALWLAFMLVRWVKWAWAVLAKEGFFKSTAKSNAISSQPEQKPDS
ncbi:MAG: hypothetical protein HWE27_06190 [Gammaproteobacteria bacterium]|nr:hypothetical protein [Gammaproteobacteria bacterium]